MLVCKTDRDCEAGLVCYSNQSWVESSSSTTTSEIHGVCLCNNFFGWKTSNEATCLLSAASYITLILAILIVLVSAVFACIGTRDTIRFLLLGSKTFTSQFLTTVCTSIGLWAMAGRSILETLGVLHPEADNYYSTDIPDAKKASSYSTSQRPLMWLAGIFLVIALLNVSMMWMEISKRSKHMSNASSKLSLHRKFVACFTAVFALFTIVTTAALETNFVVLGAQPFLLVLLIAIARGRREIVSVLDDAMQASRALGYSSDVDNQGERTLRRCLEGIRKCNKHVLFSGVGIILFSILYFVASLKERSLSEFQIVSGFSFASLSEQTVCIFVTYSLSSVLLYVHLNNRSFFRRMKAQVSVDASSFQKPSFQNGMEIDFTQSSIVSISSPKSRGMNVSTRDPNFSRPSASLSFVVDYTIDSADDQYV